jgi:hypothetical protein
MPTHVDTVVAWAEAVVGHCREGDHRRFFMADDIPSQSYGIACAECCDLEVPEYFHVLIPLSTLRQDPGHQARLFARLTSSAEGRRRIHDTLLNWVTQQLARTDLNDDAIGVSVYPPLSNDDQPRLMLIEDEPPKPRRTAWERLDDD